MLPIRRGKGADVAIKIVCHAGGLVEQRLPGQPGIGRHEDTPLPGYESLDIFGFRRLPPSGQSLHLCGDSSSHPSAPIF